MCSSWDIGTGGHGAVVADAALAGWPGAGARIVNIGAIVEQDVHPGAFAHMSPATVTTGGA